MAITFVAGPGGGSDDKPVGTVWFAFAALSNGETQVVAEHRRFQGERAAVRSASVRHALTRLLELSR